MDELFDIDFDEEFGEFEDESKLETYEMDYSSEHAELADGLIENLSNPTDTVCEEVQYPYIRIEGLDKMLEIDYVSKTLGKKEGSLPVMFELDGELFKLGEIDLNLSSFIEVLALRNYEMTICQSENESMELGVQFLESII